MNNKHTIICKNLSKLLNKNRKRTLKVIPHKAIQTASNQKLPAFTLKKITTQEYNINLGVANQKEKKSYLNLGCANY